MKSVIVESYDYVCKNRQVKRDFKVIVFDVALSLIHPVLNCIMANY